MNEETILKYLQGELSGEERLKLLKDASVEPELKKQIIDYQHVKSIVDLHPGTIDLQLGEHQYRQFMKIIIGEKRKRLFMSVLRYAAIVIFCVLSTWSAFYFNYSSDFSTLNVPMQELYVPAGQRAQLTLPDGSKVWLNADSKLSYPSVFGNERRVKLSGEGFFEVAKDEKAPFIVSTHSIDVKALGTRFNVYSYLNEDHTSVYLKEGSVSVYYPSSEDQGIILTPEQCVDEKEGKMTLVKADSDDLLWRDGIYSFKKQRLQEIIEKLECYYDVSIVVENPKIMDYLYSGKFRQRDGVMQILHIIQRIHKFNISYDERLNRIVLS